MQTGAGYDAARAARMGSFGLLFYGPYQVASIQGQLLLVVPDDACC